MPPKAHPIPTNTWARITRLPLQGHGDACFIPGSTLVCADYDAFFGVDMVVDSSSKIYGTTGACGNSFGTVWQLSP